MFDKSRRAIRVQLNHRTPPTMKLLKEDYSLDFTGSIGNNRKSQIQRSLQCNRIIDWKLLITANSLVACKQNTLYNSY